MPSTRAAVNVSTVGNSGIGSISSTPKAAIAVQDARRKSIANYAETHSAQRYHRCRMTGDV